MKIEAKEYKVQMDLDELWDLAFSVKHSLTYTLETHWIHHQNVWKQREEKKLRLLETMFNALGRLDVYKQIYQDADDIFKKFNDTHGS